MDATPATNLPLGPGPVAGCPDDVFAKLPAEIQVMILQQMHSHQDICDAIRASPTLYQTFQSHDSIIMWGWMERQMGIDNLNDLAAMVMLKHFLMEDDQDGLLSTLQEWLTKTLRTRFSEQWTGVMRAYLAMVGDLNELIVTDPAHTRTAELVYDAFSLPYLYDWQSKLQMLVALPVFVPWRSASDIPQAERQQLLRPYCFGRLVSILAGYALSHDADDLSEVHGAISAMDWELKFKACGVMHEAAFRAEWQQLNQWEAMRPGVDRGFTTYWSQYHNPMRMAHTFMAWMS